MNPDESLTPQEEIEVRLTALLAGELPPEEAAALEARIASDAALTALYARLRRAAELLREANAFPEPSAPSVELRLSSERRERLLAHFKTVPVPAAPVRSGRKWSWALPLSAAAVLMVILGGISLPVFSNVQPRGAAMKRLADARTPKSELLAEAPESPGLKVWNGVEQIPASTGSLRASRGDLGRANTPENEYVFSGGGTLGTALAPNSAAAHEESPPLVLAGGTLEVAVPGKGWTLGAAGSGKLSFTPASANSGSAAFPIAGPGAATAAAPEPLNGSNIYSGPTTLSGGKTEIRIASENTTGTGPQNSTFAGGIVLPGNVDTGSGSFPDGPAPSQSGPRIDYGVPMATAQATTEISGNTRPRDKVLRRELPLSPGTAFAPEQSNAGGTAALASVDSQVNFAKKDQSTPDQAVDKDRTQRFWNSQHASAGENVREPSSNGESLAGVAAAALPAQAPAQDQVAPRDATGPTSGQSELQRYPGQRATTSLGAVFQTINPDSMPAAASAAPAFQAQQTPGKEPQTAAMDSLANYAPTPEKESLPAAGSDKAQRQAKIPLPGAAAKTDAASKSGVELSRNMIGREPALSMDAAKPMEVAKLETEGVEKQKKLMEEASAVLGKKAAAAAAIPQPEIQTSATPFSTFSLNVSDVSFKLAAASLEQGKMPEAASVRSEEFINAFDYRDPEPAPGAPLAFAAERARYPFAQNRDLLRFSVKTAAAGRQPGHHLNIVLLLDKSGSMERADRVKIVHEALAVLAAQLQPQDQLSIVTFARTPRLWADGVAGDKAGKMIARVGEITPEGGTNLEAALDLGYTTAHRHYAVGSINRVVLFTDGAANLGDVNADALTKKVEAQRKQGIALDCFGIGWEDYNDNLLEQLTRRGDGRYGFINTPEEAAANFAAQLAGAFQVAASDVKVQVEFNPRRVTAYRQIGYAKHQLKKEEFRDNSVAAASIGAAESGNALYVVEVNPRGEGDLAMVRVRFRVPGTSEFQEHEWPVPFTGSAAPLEQASPALRLAATAGAFAEWLATSPYATEVTPDRLLGLVNGVPAVYGADPRPKKLEWMIRQAKSLSGR